MPLRIADYFTAAGHQMQLTWSALSLEDPIRKSLLDEPLHTNNFPPYDGTVFGQVDGIAGKQRV